MSKFIDDHNKQLEIYLDYLYVKLGDVEEDLKKTDQKTQPEKYAMFEVLKNRFISNIRAIEDELRAGNEEKGNNK
ncbi:MAG: hypothetical protein J5689_00900 [Clostridia bacterium]|nr:hypothetical protein [Clostridia bacterium]